MPHQRRAAHTPLGYAWETFERAKKVFDMGYWGASIAVFQQALTRFEEQHEDQGVAMCRAALAAAFNNNGRPQEAVNYALQSLQFYERVDSKPQLAEQQQNLALMYTALGDYEEAERFHLLAAENFEAFRQAEYAAQNRHTAANLLARRNETDRAREHFIEAIGLFRQADTVSAQHGKATSLMQLAYLEKIAQNSDAARLLYLEALELFEQLQAPWETGTCLEGLAAVEFEANEPHHASVHAKEALEVFKEHGFDEDARRAAANYQATLIAESFARRDDAAKGSATETRNGKQKPESD